MPISDIQGIATLHQHGEQDEGHTMEYHACNTVMAFYGIMALLVACITWIFGARSQNNRYVRRQRDFNKILFYLNRRQFAKRGIVFSSGKYGAYLVIKLRLENAELIAQQVRDSMGDDDTRPFRKTEFSKSLLLEPLDESKTDESEDSRKNLIDDFMQRDMWKE